MTRALQTLFILAALVLAGVALYWLGRPNYPSAGLFGFFSAVCLWMPLELANDKRRARETLNARPRAAAVN